MKKISIGIYLTLVFIGTYFVLPSPSLAANDCTSSGMRCVDPNIGCDPGSERYDSSQQCPDNGTGILLSCCVATGQQQQTCASVGGTCKTSCSNGETASGQRDCTWQQGLTCCISSGNVSCHAGGEAGSCSASGSCNSNTSNWYNAYSPVNICLGYGGGCCVPKPASTTNGSNPLCGTGANLDLGVNTAIGCLMAGDPKQLISQLLGWGVAVGGGIAFLMIVLAGFQMATASGDPKKVQAARELLMSAIAGLLLIIFSILLLNLIGFQILKLPGFNVNLL